MHEDKEADEWRDEPPEEEAIRCEERVERLWEAIDIIHVENVVCEREQERGRKE